MVGIKVRKWLRSSIGGLEGLSDTFIDVQTDHLNLIQRNNELLLKDPPTREFETMTADETSRIPSPIKSAVFADVSSEPPNVLPVADISILVCPGADEKCRSVAVVEHVATLVRDSRFEPFEESGHCITIEEPERFNQILRDFVDS